MKDATVTGQEPSGSVPWVLLIHQLPPEPAYLRVKVRRRLQGLGAQALKNSVYALPHSAQSLEDLHWLRREIVASGGEATVVAADFLEGMSDAELQGAFLTASAAEYRDFLGALDGVPQAPGESDAARWRSRLRSITERDYFHAEGRVVAERALEARLSPSPESHAQGSAPSGARPRGGTWVTRRDVHVDRMASGWLIRRFIDPEARFKFVVAQGYRPDPGELRFDMFDGEFTHEGDRCTFETLCHRFHLSDAAFTALGEIINDLDLKAETVRRPETEGVRSMLDGIVRGIAEDALRFEAASPMLDALWAHFSAIARD